MSASFRSGTVSEDFDLPQNFPNLIESPSEWDSFRSFKRLLASRFSITDFGCELVAGSYIIFPLDKQQQEKPKEASELKQFLDTFVVFGERSPKSAELFELAVAQKKKFAESHDFLKALRLSTLKFTAQLVVLRQEASKHPELQQALNNKCLPISSMGDLEHSRTLVSLKEALDFTTQQGLVLLGAQRAYDDLLDHWNQALSPDEKQARDASGAAPFWAAQQERFVELAQQLKGWPDFGTSSLSAPLAKDSLLWDGKEALTDTKVKHQERQQSIKTAYHKDFRLQRKHEIICRDALKQSPSFRKRPLPQDFQAHQQPRPPLPSAPKPSSPSMPPTITSPRGLFTAGSSPKNFQGLRNFKSKAVRCARCQRVGHIQKNCRF